jgi:hypothetical protein
MQSPSRALQFADVSGDARGLFGSKNGAGRASLHEETAMKTITIVAACAWLAASLAPIAFAQETPPQAPPPTEAPATPPSPDQTAAPPPAPTDPSATAPSVPEPARTCRTRKDVGEACACRAAPDEVGVVEAAPEGGRNMCVVRIQR